MSGRASSPVLVGRGEYLAVLDAALDRARDSVPSTVLVGGEAGIGKTRLTSEFAVRAADAGTGVLISYTYTSNLATYTTITLTNQLMGYAPEFRMFLFNNFRNKYFGLELYSCTMGSISIPTKQEDFWI